MPAIDNIANAMYEAAARDYGGKKRRYLGMSSIGGECDRALWLGFRGYPENPVDGRMSMLFRFGDRIEEEVIRFLGLAGYRVEGQQDEFMDFDGMFRGHCDGIVHGVTKNTHILEVKSASDSRFKAFKQRGVLTTSAVYYAQVQCYMGYSGLERALFVIQNKNTSEIYTERVHFSVKDFENLKNRAKSIIYSEQMPPAFDPGATQCRWCSKSMVCRNMEDVVSEAVCGTCHYFGFGKNLKKWCRHPKHVVEIKQWGVGCPDWSDMFEKFIADDTRPERVDVGR